MLKHCDMYAVTSERIIFSVYINIYICIFMLASMQFHKNLYHFLCRVLVQCLTQKLRMHTCKICRDLHRQIGGLLQILATLLWRSMEGVLNWIKNQLCLTMKMEVGYITLFPLLFFFPCVK